MRALAGALALALLLAGCGQTGDLYWPEDEQTVVGEDEQQGVVDEDDDS